MIAGAGRHQATSHSNSTYGLRSPGLQAPATMAIYD